jgi:uncharacterized protein
LASIRICAGGLCATAELNSHPTAQRILLALPISAQAGVWGDEVYLAIPVSDREHEATPVVAVGDLAYWPPGNAFCIFFGPTPASSGDECRAAGPVNVIGRLTSDPLAFREVAQGTPVVVELCQEDGA